jgi:Ni/Co efflux regulator RcnB
MRKVCYVLAAVTALSVAAPTLASAQEFGFRIGSDHGYYRDRDYGYDRGYDRGWHHGWYNHDRDRTVVIRRHHHWDYDD